MSLRKILFVICLVITAFSLAAGFATAGDRVLALLAVLLAPAWLIARKYADTWLSFFCLLASVGLAVAGILIGASSLWMFLGSGFSLAAWDLVLFNAAFENHPPGEQTRLYEMKHIQSLVLALGLGLLLLFLGRSFTFQIPFVVLILFITFVLFGLNRILFRLTKNANKKIV
jgi:hypothetical protein